MKERMVPLGVEGRQSCRERRHGASRLTGRVLHVTDELNWPIEPSSPVGAIKTPQVKLCQTPSERVRRGLVEETKKKRRRRRRRR